jgi:Leucine-rich repeat (LRR) protein
MKDHDIVAKIRGMIPTASFEFEGENCIKAVFTNSECKFYGILRLFSIEDKKEILNLISKLHCLRHLDLRKNKLGKIDLGLTCLQHLDLGSNYMGEVPSWIRKNNLTYLNLGVNELNDLPSWFGDLSSLEVLKIHKNKINDFSTLSSFFSLRELNLYFNCVNKIPHFIFNFVNMNYFSWGMSSIEELSDSICKLVNLHYLSIVGNRLKYLPDSICLCENMIGMRLSKNKIECLPDQIGLMKKLKMISLYKNELRFLPDSFYELNLEKCNLANNCFSNKPKVTCNWYAFNDEDLDWEWKK